MDKHPVFNLSIHARMRASERLGAVYAVACYEAIGLTRTAAIAVVSSRYGVSASALWRWLGSMPHGVSIQPHDMLLALADTHASREATSSQIARLLAESQKAADAVCAVFDPNRQQAGWIDPAAACATRAAIAAERDAWKGSLKKGGVMLAVAFTPWVAILLLAAAL